MFPMLKIRCNQMRQPRHLELPYLETNDLDELNMTRLYFEYRLTVYRLPKL